jgi:diguanylate cyclase (GGDEF)-like protein
MNQSLLDSVLQSPRLPSLPTIAIEVIDLVQQKDVNIKQIAHTISHDPALSSKILKTVNSSFYGQAHSIATVSHALVILGLNSVKTLALGFSLVPNLKHSGGDGFDHMAFWRRSLYTAVAARTLARQAGLPQQEEVFLGGLLQDLGMLAMNQALGDDYRKILSTAGVDHNRLWVLEQERFEADHAEIGGALAERWNLPPVLVNPIRFHEQPDSAPEPLRQLVRCIALGNRVAEIFMLEAAGPSLDLYFAQAQEWLGFSREQAEPLLTASHRNSVEMRSLFDLPTGPLGNPDEILARATDTLLQISLQSQKEAGELQNQNKALTEQAFTDSLTGVANRRRFNEFLADEFKAARDANVPLSILFLDTDHFKLFNDKHGHQLGDRVLVELGALLKKSSPRTALVARYGGEEFAIVLPEINRVAAARCAEQIRALIEASPVENDAGEKLRVTASIGVATLDGPFFERPEQLVKAADQGVYAAKHAGRNCVRVFTPRVAPKPQPTAAA